MASLCLRREVTPRFSAQSFVSLNIKPGRPVLKILWSRWHKQLGELAMEVQGAPSMVAQDEPYDLDEWQRLFLFSRADTIYGGFDEIQRNIVASRALGLPRPEKP
jgi:alkylation response protein AidB-like acyl-CoA dehydrogenase